MTVRNSGIRVTPRSVHKIVVPYILIVVDMQHQHTTGRQSRIPCHSLTVLDKEILIWVSAVYQHIRITVLGKRRHAANRQFIALADNNR